ncbi:hypothetical protein, partial [Streptomyces sp. NPDC048623]|uniref:hypothetical protein n=1 Tax=Streptomyces sp. NPDC048623 TaxID=3155761 RepID=UPI0034277814
MLRGRVDGAGHVHPGPLSYCDDAELVGGPLGGLLFGIAGWSAEEILTGVALMAGLGRFGPGGRVLYGARPGGRNRWDWSGDAPCFPSYGRRFVLGAAAVVFVVGMKREMPCSRRRASSSRRL